MSHSFLYPFLDERRPYAYGVELGIQDQILLAASRLGWHVEVIEPFEKGWFRLIMRPRGDDFHAGRVLRE